MFINDYQSKALSTFINRDGEDVTSRLVLGLVEEAGEVAGKFKKRLRGDDFEDFTSMITKELGDVLWYLAVLADHLGINMDEIATSNLDKLAGRAERNVIKGSGDNR